MSSKATMPARSRGRDFRKTSIQIDVSTSVTPGLDDAWAARRGASPRGPLPTCPTRAARVSVSPLPDARTPRALARRSSSRSSHRSAASPRPAGPPEAQDSYASCVSSTCAVRHAQAVRRAVETRDGRSRRSWHRTGAPRYNAAVAGILRYGSYVPYFRLTRAAIGAGKGERAVASYDEDSVSMAVEAARDAVRGGVSLDALLFATLSPPYAEKLNAATIQAALDLPEQIASVELAGSSRMGLGARLLGLDLAAAGRRTLVCASDVVVGAPGGGRESQGGDAAVAFVTGPDGEAIARLVGRASSTMEILDVWRLPEERFGRQWEERFTADTMAPAIADTAQRALQSAGVEPASLTTVILDGTNARSLAGLPKALGLKPEQLADPLLASVGRAGTAHAGLLLARALDAASPGDRILVVCEADGADALVFEVTPAIKDMPPVRKVDRWIASK